MDKAICFTQLFVDKQNVRSYGNIFNLSLLKDDNNMLFLQNIFSEEQTLVSILSPEILDILVTLRRNLRFCSKDDFKSYFLRSNNTELMPINKCNVLNMCLNALSDIIPNSLYGNRHNKELFRRIVQIVIHGMKRQYIFFGKLVSKWCVSVKPWQFLPEVNKLLYYLLIWIIQNVLSAMVCLNFVVTTTKLDADENKLHFFWKNNWQSFYDKMICRMIRQKILRKVNSYCLVKKAKNYNVKRRHILRNIIKNTPKLHFVLKCNNNFRPIIRYHNEVQNQTEKYVMKSRLNFLKMLVGKSHKMEKLFRSLHEKWIHLNKPKLYFIKTDLSNAFGCVDKKKLNTILHNKFMKYYNMETKASLLAKNTQLYREIIAELKKPILIRAGSTIFEWKQGLVQGYKYSPVLSELYYKHLDEIYFKDHTKKTKDEEIRLFIRVVDDYMYITDSLDDANNFLKALNSYKNVNKDKTVVNFHHDTIKCSNKITFLGYCYNTTSMEVSRAENVFVGQMCYKISFNNTIENIGCFLESRIGQSSIHINNHIFNLAYNEESLIWHHIFTTFCLSANKFCTILALLCDPNDISKYIQLYKKKVTVRLANNMIDVLTRSRPHNVMFLYCINHFRYLSWLAISLCAKRTPKCGSLVSQINDELSKSNCIFGKWKEHASRIDSNGQKLQIANRDICRKTDLRVIFKQFVSLPEGFQCYDEKLLFKN